MAPRTTARYTTIQQRNDNLMFKKRHKGAQTTLVSIASSCENKRRRDGKGTEGEETAAEPANQRLRPCMPQPVGQGMLCGPHSNDMLAR